MSEPDKHEAMYLQYNPKQFDAHMPKRSYNSLKYFLTLSFIKE